MLTSVSGEVTVCTEAFNVVFYCLVAIMIHLWRLLGGSFKRRGFKSMRSSALMSFTPISDPLGWVSHDQH